MSSPRYFKFRGRFDFSPHRYDIGRPVFQNRALEDNFFLLKIYELDESEYSAFYNHQLAFYLDEHPDSEEVFFKHIHDIVTSRIRHFKRQDPFSSKYALALEHIKQLETFLAFLKTIDRWHKVEPLESVIGEKDNQIDKLKERIAELEDQLKGATKYDAAEKVVIDRGGMPAFMDLVDQIQQLTLPTGNKLARSQTQSPWYKMIAKYFMHGDKEISIDTARNYFPAKKGDKPAKFIEVAEKDKLFKIVRKDDK